MNTKFRPLTAREIECRVQQVKQTGLSLLLYKDARCDMAILDEAVGPENWQRSHSRDNANCTVSIWDDAKKAWISKEDTGTESNTEAQKGLASDSFKRACVNWGIGRELYTSPFIWVPSTACKITEKGKDKFNKPIFTCNDRFEVSEIGYNEHREINRLVIVNEKTKAVVFSFGSPARPAETAQQAPIIPNADHIKQLELIVAAVKDHSSANEAMVRIGNMNLIPEATSQFKNAVYKRAKSLGCTFNKETGFFSAG